MMPVGHSKKMSLEITLIISDGNQEEEIINDEINEGKPSDYRFQIQHSDIDSNSTTFIHNKFDVSADTDKVFHKIKGKIP